MSEKSIKHISLRLAISLAAIALLASIALACYGFVIRAQAESLLKDVTALRVGESTEAVWENFVDSRGNPTSLPEMRNHSVG